MIDLKRMEKRIECCDLVKKHALSWNVTRECNEEMLLGNLECLIQRGNCAEFGAFSGAGQAAIMRSREILKYVLDFLDAGIRASRIELLMKEIPLEVLRADYPEDEVRDALQDERIEADCMGIYLRYYRHDGLAGEELRHLWAGVKWFRLYRKHLTDDWIGTIGEERRMMLEPSVAGCCLTGTDVDRWMAVLSEKRDLRRLLNEMYPFGCGRVVPDDDNMEEMAESAGRLLALWHWAEGFFSKEELERFFPLWMENHAMVYDLESLKRKVDGGYAVSREALLGGRASYLAFFYNESFPEPLFGVHEELAIYAITRRKKAFLKLLRENVDLFREIPAKSVLFCRLFYEKCVNLNTLNRRNLDACKKMTDVRREKMELICGKGYTFEEIFLILWLPDVYITFYGKLAALRSDDRIRIMREIIRKGYLKEGMNLEAVSEKLICKPLSEWLRQDFRHIRGLTGKNATLLLSMHREIGHLIPDIRSNAEARYVLENSAKCRECLTMEELRENAAAYDNDWSYLSGEFGFSAQFVDENRERVRDFIFNDGAHIFRIYYDAEKGKAEELRRLVSAEVMGRFKELKYFRDDLTKEIDYPVTEEQKHEWMRNTSECEGQLTLWEEDGLIPVMKMGVMPYETCLSYSSGSYRQCLLACHDANKKVVYLSYKGTVVLRAAIRLTKGTYQEKGKSVSGKSQLHFADLAAYDKGLEERSAPHKEKEYLTLFLESAYVAGLPEKMTDKAFGMLFSLMQKKAESMHVLFAASMSYLNKLSDKMIPVSYSMYISISKAGEQYLDSMGGSKRVDKEGSYERSKYLLEKAKVRIMEDAG